MTKIHSADSEEITITSVINQLKNLGEQLNGNSQKVSDAYSDPTTNTQAEVDKHSHVGDRLAENLEEEMSKIYSIKQKFVGTTKVYVCRFCDKESKKPSDLIRHIRIHTKEKPFKCFCGNSFSLKSTLITHIQTHKKRNGRQCASCSRTFFSTKAWNKHMRKHNSSTSEDISLKMCNSQTSKDGLLEHMPKKNTNNISILRKVNLKRHIQSHTGHNRFSCKTCLRSFNDVLAMKEHMKLHDLKHLSCEICDKKFARKSLLIRHTKTHSTVMPYECFYCKKKFKHILMLRKHIDTHTKCDGQEKALGTQSIVFTEANGLVEQNAERPAAILKVDSSGMILDHIYDNDRDKLAVNASSDISTLPIRLELGENQDFQTIFMNCSGIPSEEALGNYFFSQLKLQPNDTLVLNSTNNDLEPTSLLFNVQTVDNETLPVIDIMDSQVYDDDCTDKLIEPSLQSPQIKSSAIKTDQVLSMVDKNQENCLQNDMSDDFLANTVSLYPNTKISFENSEINPVPLDLIAPESDKYSEKSGNENGADSLSLFDINLRQDQHENNAALNIIHCLVCKKMFYNIEVYNSHVCMKADSKKSSVNENVQIESNPGTTSNILKSSKIQEKPEKSTKRLFHCVYCGKEFTSRGIYMRHVATHQKNGDRLHKCKFCEKQFKKPSDLSRHLRTHTGEKPFACDKCDKKFSLKSTLEGHYRTHNPQATKDFVCEVCNSFFSSNSSRKLHMLIHTGDKPHKCTFCDQKFRTVAHKKKHEQKIHLSRSKKITQGKANRITNILATAADMAMKNLEGNRDNMLEQQEETGPTMIQLEYPDQANPTVKLTESIQIDPAVLQLLQNSNILLQDINTDVFHLSENTLENLERTQIITTVEVDDGRNLDCEICHKKYASKEVLRKHMKLHLKNKFVCEQCKKWFPTIEALVEHEKLHAGHRPFSCFLCTNTFAELHHLKSHLKRIHQVVETNSASILKMSL
ncbi:hypothetical protein HHI36_008818 [Cryptolaemus montrouzieri]|uniref:C2H2-type domain-containing protein n=1 Tax=Cryptolaemus montrouzieri TaxID=559131 RepID=A0ABD2MTN8_9CUCU